MFFQGIVLLITRTEIMTPRENDAGLIGPADKKKWIRVCEGAFVFFLFFYLPIFLLNITKQVSPFYTSVFFYSLHKFPFYL